MHCVRSLPAHSPAAVIVNELDLSVSNLRSGYSYCLTLLGSSYVWHGRGARKEERTAARVYVRGLSAENAEVVELVEGVDDEDELFWMMLGEKEYTKAEYWKWRASFDEIADGGGEGASPWSSTGYMMLSREKEMVVVVRRLAKPELSASQIRKCHIRHSVMHSYHTHSTRQTCILRMISFIYKIYN